MSQHARGIVERELGGKPYTFALNFAAIADIEAAMNAGLSALLSRLQQLDVRHTDIVNLLFYTARQGGNPIERDALLELVAADVDGAFAICSDIVLTGFGPPEVPADAADAASEADAGKPPAAA